MLRAECNSTSGETILPPTDDKTLYNTVFKKLLDIGDIISVTGHVFTTQTGELSVYVKQFVILNKSLRPLPVVKEVVNEQTGERETYDAFTDPEQRYRPAIRRYDRESAGARCIREA